MHATGEASLTLLRVELKRALEEIKSNSVVTRTAALASLAGAVDIPLDAFTRDALDTALHTVKERLRELELDKERRSLRRRGRDSRSG